MGSPPVASADASATVLGVDLGGTKIALMIVDGDGAVVQTHRLPTAPQRGAARVLSDTAAAARAAFGTLFDGVRGVGVSVAGQVTPDGTLVGAPNLGWSQVPLRAEVERAFQRPAFVINDVRAATWAEWRHGAGRGCDDFIVLYLGTGIGGGAVIDGRMLEGANNILGEFGHMTLVAGGRPCHCRNVGCLEAYTAGWSIAERARDAVRDDPTAGAALIRLAGGDVELITAKTVAQARSQRDPLAERLVQETGELLGPALVSLVNAFNPTRVILGGGIINGFPELVSLAHAHVRERALVAALQGLDIVPAELANDAPTIGAAAMARHLIDSSTRGVAT